MNLSKEKIAAAPAVITLQLNNSAPIELSAFVGAFTSLANEYRKSLATNDEFENEAEIYVKEVRAGSIIADLVPVIVSTAPVIASHADQIWHAVNFVKTWEKRITELASGIIPERFSKSDMKSFADAVEAIAWDPQSSSQLEVATFEDGKREVKAAFKFSAKEAVAVQNTIEAEYLRLDKEVDDQVRRTLMYFTRSDVGAAPKDKRSGEKVKIPEVSEKSLPIIYASSLAEERIKHEIREANDKIYKKGFSVDVSILYRGSKPIVYRILAVYEIIDLPDDD